MKLSDSLTPVWLARPRWRRALLAGSALLALALVPGLMRLGTDNSPEVFFVRGSDAVARYQAFRQDFGGDPIVRLVAAGDGLWTAAGLQWLAGLEDDTATTPGVASVSGLAQYFRRRGGWPAADAADEEVAAFRLQARTNRLARSLGWVSADGTTVTAIAFLEDMDPREERRLFDRLRVLLASAPAGVTTGLVGPPLLNHALDDSSREIESRYFPLLVGFSLLILLVTIRDLAGLLTPLLFVGFCELLVLAPMGYAGVKLNMVLAVLPPLLFVIALATALHVLLRFRDLRAESPAATAAEVVIATYREKGWSVLGTGLTTLIGFASLTLSPVGPVRALGAWAALGIGLMTLAAFTVYPALLALPTSGLRQPSAVEAVGMECRPKAFERHAHRLGALWARGVHRRRGTLLWAATLLALVAVVGWPRIRLGSNVLHYLDAGHPVRAEIEALQDRGIGLAAVEVLISPRGEAPFQAVGQVSELARLGDSLAREALVYGAMSAGAVLRDAAEWAPRVPFMDAGTHLAVVLQTLEADPEGGRVLNAFLSPDRSRARVTAFTATAGLDDLDPLMERIRGLALAAFPGAEVEITGEFPLLLESQRHLLSTLAVSLGLTLAAIALILRMLLPGNRLTLLVLLPNLWPVVGLLGVMGWFDVPLDIATVMVASVVLGLAVDGTLHALGHFRRLAPRLGVTEAVTRTLEITAPAYLLTGVILAAGFGVCALSDFAPIARFGAISAVAIVLATLGNLFLIPALLSLTPRGTLDKFSGDQKLST